MKLTKIQLKQIIKEELGKINEISLNPLEDIYRALHELANGLDQLNERMSRLEEGEPSDQ